MRLPIQSRRLGIVAPFLAWLYALPGYVEDGQTWIEWIQESFTEWQGWQYVFMVLAVAVAMYGILPDKVLVWLGGQSVSDEDQQDVLRMMRGLSSYLEDSKKMRLEDSALIPGSRNLSESIQRSRRAGIWKRKLRGIGLHPTKSDPSESENFMWDTYLDWIIPMVEEEGIEAARRETKRIFNRSSWKRLKTFKISF